MKQAKVNLKWADKDGGKWGFICDDFYEITYRLGNVWKLQYNRISKETTVLYRDGTLMEIL